MLVKDEILFISGTNVRRIVNFTWECLDNAYGIILNIPEFVSGNKCHFG